MKKTGFMIFGMSMHVSSGAGGTRRTAAGLPRFLDVMLKKHDA